MKYPRGTNFDEDMLERLTSSALIDISPQVDLSYIIDASTHITPLASLSERENKREYPKAMDVEEGETTKMPKKHKIEESDELM